MECFHAAIHLVIEAIGQDFNNGKLVLNPALIEYLEKKGMFDAE